MAKVKTTESDVIRCYCLSNGGRLHCPLSTDRRTLELTFNYQVRQENIVWVDIDKNFVCTDERKSSCEKCPFK